MDKFFYIDKLLKYVKKNINTIPTRRLNPNEPKIKNFINTCCNIVKSHNIQIFISSIETPLIINKKMIGSVFVELTKTNIFKNLKVSDEHNKLQFVYSKFKTILSKVCIIEKILYISFQEENDYTKYLYKVLMHFNLENTRIIKQYVFPFYKIPEDNDTYVKIMLFNRDLSINNNNITFLNIKKIILKKNILESKQEILINKLGQFYINILLNNIIISSNYDTIDDINIIELKFNNFLNLLSDSINKCVICGIYDKHFTNFQYIDYYYTEHGFYCEFCEKVFNKDKLISFVMNNIIEII